MDTRYQAMDDGELLALAAAPDQLTPEAQTFVAHELARRRINPGKLSEELREEVKARNGFERRWNPDGLYFFWPGLRWLVARVKDWRKFRHQTGQFPVLSILTYCLHAAFALFMLVLFAWYALPRRRSDWAPLALLVTFGHRRFLFLGLAPP